MKRLFIDIETSPNVVLSWRVGYKIRIDPDNILKERAIICGCWKWQHEKAVHGITWDKEQNDKPVVDKFVELMSEADEVVAQNGDNFDIPWLKTRFLFHGGQSLPRIKTVDTLQWAKRNLYFNSNKLDYMAGYLGIGRKIHTEFGLWKEIVLNQNQKSLEKMMVYCKQDIILLQKVWERLQLLVAPKTHNAVLLNGEKWQCPRCASDNVITSKKKVTAAGTIQHQMQCKKCGGFFTVGSTAHKLYQEEMKRRKDEA